MHDPEQRHGRDGVPPEGEIPTGPGGPEHGRATVRGLWRHRPARGRTVAVAAAAAVLALGGTVAYAATSGNSGGGTPSAPASSSAPWSDDGPGFRHGPGMWSGMGGGVHGEVTVKDPDSGDWVVRTWQRGTVEKVAGDRVTVRSEDGASWTWTVGPDTAVRTDGGRMSGADALKKGDTVLVAGTRSGETRTAGHVLSGTFEGKAPDDDRRDGSPRSGHGHHGWNDEAGTPSPAPSGNGART